MTPPPPPFPPPPLSAARRSPEDGRGGSGLRSPTCEYTSPGRRAWAVGARSGHCWPHPRGPLRGEGWGVADSRQLCSGYSGPGWGHPLPLPNPQLLPGFLCCFKVRPIKQPPAQQGPSVSSGPLGPDCPACVVMGSPLPLWASVVPRGTPYRHVAAAVWTPQGQGHSPYTAPHRTCTYQNGTERLRNARRPLRSEAAAVHGVHCRQAGLCGRV